MAQGTLAAKEERNLLRTLSSFTRDEIVRFRDYIISSYKGNKGPLLEFIDALVPVISAGRVPAAGQMLKLLLKTARLGTATYTSLFLDLSRLVQGFLKSDRYKGKPERAVNDLLTAVNARRLNKLFDINISLARKIRSDVSGKSADAYLRNFMADTEDGFRSALAAAGKEKNSAEALIGMLDEFYLVNKLRYYCASRHFGRADQADSAEFFEELISRAGSKAFNGMLQVQVYLVIYRMLEDEEDTAHFNSLKSILKTNQKRLPDVILRDAYVFAINYCVRRINQGRFNFLRDVYELYQIALDKRFLYDEGELSPWDYSRIIDLGAQIRGFRWSEKLIEVYKERIPSAGKNMNVVTFNLAKMYFFSGRYQDVLLLIEGVKSSELMYILGCNALLIKTYYETGNQTALHRALLNFRNNLKRRKRMESKERDAYLFFIDLIMRLSQFPKRDRKALRLLKQEVMARPDTPEAEWLLEKLK